MVRRSRGFRSAALVASLALAGCAESIYLSSRPQGANVSINGEPVGRTPLTYSVRPSDWHPPYKYRVEREGYAPAEGTLATGLSEGRVIGGIFTLGLSLFFKQPATFVEQEHVFDLESASTTGVAPPKKTEGRPRGEPRPPAVPYEPPSDQGIYRYEHPAAPAPSPVPQPTPTRVRKPSPSPQAGEKPRPTSSPKPKPRLSPTAVSPPPPPPPKSSAPPPPPAAAPLPAAAAKPSVQEDLDRLRKLRDEGVIPDAEYEQLRESVLKGQ